MRVLLVNPFYPLSETPSPPLGLAFLAAALEQAGAEVKILDLAVFPYSENLLASVLRTFSPRIVGVTCVTMSFHPAMAVLQDVKRMDPETLTVMGGPHVTFCAPQTLQAFPELDIVVLGEGEETIVELAKAVHRKEPWQTVRGIAYRKGSKIISTGNRTPLLDMNSLTVPARHLLALGRYKALNLSLSMTTSRGCPFKCIFCVGRKMVGAKVRYRNPQKVVDEMEYLNSLNFNQINIADDLFTANATHCHGVCDEIKKRNLTVRWTAFARVDTVSAELLGEMRDAGCHTVSFGVESANPEILKTIKKGITLPQVLAAVKMCHAAGITPHVSFILGLPGETPETLKETVQFGKRLKDMGALHGFHLLAPFPGTEIRECSHRYDLKILSDDWREYHANRAIVETSSVSRQALDAAVMEWENEALNWLGQIARRLETGQATEAEAYPLINLERTVLLYDLMMGKAIEEKGTWPLTGRESSDTDAVRVLSEKIAATASYSSEKIFSALSYAADRGTLNCIEKQGQIHWQWVDFM